MRTQGTPPATDAPRRYADGETITHQGDRPHAPGLVVDGSVRVAIVSEEGREAVIALLGPGDVFDECAVVGVPSPVGVRALGATTVRRVDASQVTDALARRSLDATALLEDALLRDVRGRVERLLAMLDRRGAVAVTQEELGRMVGAARETVNRALRDLDAASPVPGGSRRRTPRTGAAARSSADRSARTGASAARGTVRPPPPARPRPRPGA